ncbi:16228_t:CDS:2 [Dentiscutata erythropus]|uniref:16228_t:CDS:1 n=1 Tax=Dentiscutata erythropus TaxID=1348616 RepID=A0A9N9CFM4_9GLOM|nr:16228_t:CDS:2 [Dentiscutata erythropus]
MQLEIFDQSLSKDPTWPCLYYEENVSFDAPKEIHEVYIPDDNDVNDTSRYRTPVKKKKYKINLDEARMIKVEEEKEKRKQII